MMRPVVMTLVFVPLWSLLLLGCGAIGTEKCDPDIVKAFRDLPPVEGVEVDLHGSPGIGCTDTVTPSDPKAFLDHYEQAMRDAGWSVTSDGSGFFGTGPSGGVTVDPLEGNDVGVYALSLDEIQSP